MKKRFKIEDLRLKIENQTSNIKHRKKIQPFAFTSVRANLVFALHRREKERVRVGSLQVFNFSSFSIFLQPLEVGYE